MRELLRVKVQRNTYVLVLRRRVGKNGLPEGVRLGTPLPRSVKAVFDVEVEVKGVLGGIHWEFREVRHAGTMMGIIVGWFLENPKATEAEFDRAVSRGAIHIPSTACERIG